MGLVLLSLTLCLYMRETRGEHLRTMPCSMLSGNAMGASLFCVFSSSPPNSHIAVRMCVWLMEVNGQYMQWAPKLMSPSWIHGSHHTTSSLFAPGSEAVVRVLVFWICLFSIIIKMFTFQTGRIVCIMRVERERINRLCCNDAYNVNSF